MHIIDIQCLSRKIQFAILFIYLVIDLILSMLFSGFVGLNVLYTTLFNFMESFDNKTL